LRSKTADLDDTLLKLLLNMLIYHDKLRYHVKFRLVSTLGKTPEYCWDFVEIPLNMLIYLDKLRYFVKFRLVSASLSSFLMSCIVWKRKTENGKRKTENGKRVN